MILPPALLTRGSKEPVAHDGPPRTAIVLSILVTILLFLSPFILSKTGIRRFFSQQQRDVPPRTRIVCLTPDALELMPITKYRASRESKAKASQGSILPTDEFQTCSICTEDFLEDVNLRPLPCGHRFHPSCIDPWLLERSVTCPLWYVP